MKNNGFFAENKIKNNIQQQLFKYKRRISIHEHGKQKNK